MSAFSYDVIHKPGKLNVTPDALSQICGSILPEKDCLNLNGIHQTLDHIEDVQLHHILKSKNLSYSMEEVKEVDRLCQICAELKPRYFRKEEALIQATQARQRLSIDLKKPVKGRNTYVLIAVDEYSRFPFAFPCKNMNSRTVINCLNQLFLLI